MISSRIVIGGRGNISQGSKLTGQLRGCVWVLGVRELGTFVISESCTCGNPPPFPKRSASLRPAGTANPYRASVETS